MEGRINNKMDTLHQELKEEIKIRTEALSYRIDGVEKRLDAKIDSVKTGLEKKMDDIGVKLDTHIEKCESDISLLKKASNL